MAEQASTLVAAGHAEADTAGSDKSPTNATSEANIAATDPNAPATPTTADPDKHTQDEDRILDTKAADLTQGAVSGAVVPAPDTGSTPASARKKEAKKKSAGVPEHKSKKLGRKKSMPDLHLDCEAGDYYWARMKGYAPWPSIICDEEMLPEDLIKNRPVTAKRPDGTYREDFREGGKNARDRTYPIMFLGSNEFAWMTNTDLRPLNVEDVEEPKNTNKMSKALLDAYAQAKEQHDLQHYKDMLAEHEQQLADIMEQEAKKQQAAQEKAQRREEKKAKRKSKDAADADVDVSMDDAEGEPKSSKKRKKDAQSDAEDKPAKTPKTKLKLTSKATNGNTPTPKSKAAGSATKPTKASKAAAAAVAASESSPGIKTKPMSEAEKQQKLEKEVLYFRHKLQKGFLTTDQAPKEEEMKVMSEYISSLETYKNIDAKTLRKTKIHKVLKGILKLTSIPKDEEYQFKERSFTLLGGWNKLLDADTVGEPSAKKEEATTNGDKKSSDEKKDEEPASEGEPKPIREKKTEEDEDASLVEDKTDDAPEPPMADEKTVEAAAATGEKKEDHEMTKEEAAAEAEP